MSSTRRFHVEIDVEIPNGPEFAEREGAVIETVKNAARQMFAGALMIVGDRPPPKISVWGESLDDGLADISLKQEEEV